MEEKKANFKIIGLGGIGSVLTDFLAQYLNYSYNGEARMFLVDGDKYEPKNAARQSFSEYGNKAEVKVEELASKFQKISFRPIDEFIDKKNAAEIIEERDIVFLVVDNHKTRKIVSKQCQKLNNIVLISGGNELTDGNVQVYLKKEGKEITAPLEAYHPEIENPKDKMPNELSCTERQKSEPQLLFTNLTVACAMLNAFYAVEKDKLAYGEVYLDIIAGKHNPVEREPLILGGQNGRKKTAKKS
jgi:molybdopterin/thiamine biosynthesis adenylyltransferase